MLAEGDYSAVVLRGFLGFNTFGDDAACLELGIRDADKQPHTVTWEGGFSTDEWTQRTVRSLRLVGMVGSNLEAIAALKGKQINVTIKHKTSKKGTVYLQVFINPRKHMDPAESKSFAARMERAVAAVDAAEEPPSQDAEPPRGVGGPPLSRDARIMPEDVPFSLLLALLSLVPLLSAMGAA